MALPNFRYHPNPIKTGSIQASAEKCISCEQVRGYIYVSTVYSVQEIIDEICPWCIADGSAHDKFDAKFNDMDMINGLRLENSIDISIAEEVAWRTPGYDTWQGGKWATHCHDAAAFLGRVGFVEIEAYGVEAQRAIQKDTGLTDERWQNFYQELDKNGSPVAYLFQCLHCGEYAGNTDCD